MKQIWNEGRVIGYSAYEVYVKQHMSEDPNTPPASEREWLASSLAMGSSMIVKLNKFAQAVDKNKMSFVEIPLPRDSRLGAANTLLASFFDGECKWNGQFATKVTSYSDLSQNTTTRSPNRQFTYDSPDSAFPHATDALNYSDAVLNRLKSYMHIFNGVYVHPGTFTDNPSKPPEKDFAVNLKEPGKLRFAIKGNLDSDVYVLITGFTIRSVLSGVVGGDSACNTEHPEDGDFLGPAVFPWASKIIFSVPSSYITYFMLSNYQRKLATDATKIMVDSSAVIDMKSKSGSSGTVTSILNAPVAENYYKTKVTETDSLFYKSTDLNVKKNTRILNTVTDLNTLSDSTAVLTVYQKKSIYPPALYSTFVTAEGENYLHPVDIVAPGSVKVFNGGSQGDLRDYESNFPGTTSMNKTAQGTIQILNSGNKLVDVADISYADMTNEGTSFNTPHKSYTGSDKPKMIRIKTGIKSSFVLNITKNTDLTAQPTMKTISNKPSQVLKLTATNSNDNISWSSLIAALNDDLAIDLLGDRLKSAKQTLVKSRTTTQGPYLEFGPASSPLRLYITDKQPDPAGVPVGSIGIGWGFKE